MNDQLLKTLRHFFSALVITVLFVGCSASKNTTNYSTNSDGVIEAHASNINKDVVRLKGKLLSRGKKVGDRWQYDFKVLEVINYGATFASVEPKVGEEVLLVSPGQVRFKKNNEVILDALTPINRDGDKLTISMITE